MTYEEEHEPCRRVDYCHDCGVPVKTYTSMLDDDRHCIPCNGTEMSLDVEWCRDSSCDICGDKVRGIDCYPHLRNIA